VRLETSGEGVEQERGSAGLLDQSVDRVAVTGHQAVREQRLLAVDHQPAAHLVDVGGLADQSCVLHDLGLAAARLEHHLDPRAVAGLEAARGPQREGAVGVAEERAAAAEQRAVEVGVDAAEGRARHGRPYYGNGWPSRGQQCRGRP
jgi:hypothetical protein